MHDGKILVSQYKGGATDHYALIAGFAEVGETIEACVAREVFEETHLHVKNLRYYKSQPWPFSDSLLFGFFCDLDGDDHIIIEEDELAMAKWVSPEEIREENNDYSLTTRCCADSRRIMADTFISEKTGQAAAKRGGCLPCAFDIKG